MTVRLPPAAALAPDEDHDRPDSLREVWTREPSSPPPTGRTSRTPRTPFERTERPPPASLFGDHPTNDKSLDEVILSFLSEDLGPSSQK